jgi:hypothetical protein
MTWLDYLNWIEVLGIFVMLGALLRLIWSRKKQGRRLAQQEESMHPFKAGDMVILGERNPHKGNLICGKPYEVLMAGPSYISLRAENGTEGAYYANLFVPYTGLGRSMPGDGYKEYEEAIAAQEAMDEITSR